MGFYQGKNKERFINTKKTQHAKQHWAGVFKSTASFEKSLNKDLMDFTKEDIYEWIKDRSLTQHSTVNYLNWIAHYQMWGKRAGIKILPKITAKSFTKQEIEEISKEDPLVPTADLIYGMIGVASNDVVGIQELLNPQDRLIIYFLFTGVAYGDLDVYGKIQECHIDMDNERLLLSQVDDKYEDIWIDPIAKSLITQTLQAEKYFRFLSPEAAADDGVSALPFYYFEDSPYLIKKTKTAGYEVTSPVSVQTLRYRIKKISEEVYFDLTPNLIKRAGRAYIAKKIIDMGYEFHYTNEISIKSVFNRFGDFGESINYQKYNNIVKDLIGTYEGYNLKIRRSEGSRRRVLK